MESENVKIPSIIRSFGTNLFFYMTGTVATLVFGIVSTLLIPKYLSVDHYGFWQLFILYSGYIGLLQLGLGEGALVVWARDGGDLYRKEIRRALKYLVLEQIAVVIPLSILIYFVCDQTYKWLLLLLMCFSFVMNLVAIFINAAQAAKRFKSLSIILAARNLIFLIFIILLFVTDYTNYFYIVVAYILSWMIVLIAFSLIFHKDIQANNVFSTSLWDYGKKTVNIGVFVMLGNYIAVFLLSIDRLLVSSLLPISQFAVYAFASNVVVFYYYCVRAVSEVFFPYLSMALPEMRKKIYQLGRSALILIWAITLIIYFPITKLIELYLPDYTGSVSILALLICGVGFGSLIQVIHVNYYKLHNKQRIYFIIGVVSLILSTLLILLALKLTGSLEAVAAALLCSLCIWYILSELGLKAIVGEGYKGILISLMQLVSYSVIFLLIVMLPVGFWAKTIIYLLTFSVMTWCFLRFDIKELTFIAVKMKGK